MASKNKALVSLVVPSFNEEESLPVFYETCREVLTGIDVAYEFVFVDDGSADRTLDVIKDLAARDETVKYISLSRNFGHQAALRAGLEHAGGDCVISIDADLQHPPALIPELIGKWREGFEIVTTVRKDLVSLSYVRRSMSRLYYKMINLLSDFPVEPGSADFRLLDRKVVEKIRGLKEANLFMRGLVPWLGFKSCSIDYEPAERHHGTSKYNLAKLFGLAITGLTSTSIRPLRISIFLSFILAIFAVIQAIHTLFSYYYLGHIVEGWTSVMVAIYMIGAMQLFVLGLIGEYLGRVLTESLGRPSYIVRDSNIDPK